LPSTHRALFLYVLTATVAPLATVHVVEAAQVDPIVVVREYRARHSPRILREFADLLAIPNVAADSINIRRNASRLVELLTAHGARAELLTLPDVNAPPVVYGRIDVPGATHTVGIYVHYDGQPADSADWVHGPWQPTLYTRAMWAGGKPRSLPLDGDAVDPEWRFYARSASDDRAPLGALFPVLRAFREANVRLTSNVVFFFEGEEEAGSPNLGRYFEQYRDRVEDVDVWLLLDGPIQQSGRPQLVFGVRGVTNLEVTVYGAARELHSGHYGNWAPVPGRLLAELLASMYHADGSVAIDGFYDDVEPLDDVSQAALAALPRYDDELRRELGLAATEGNARLDQSILRPSLTIHGLASAQVGAGARNVIPARATASIGIRLVKGNDSTRMQELVEAHIRRQGFHVVRDEPDHATRLAHRKIARVDRGRGYPAARTRMDEPWAQSVITAARRVAGDKLLLVPGLGGSLPLYLFTDVLAKPTIIVPVVNHDNNQHAANENLRIANLWYAVELYAALLTIRSITAD
jgi:acetylornithine deacetylase/succinyl-diaminopimelate desuccinylase-like protein